MGSRYSRRQFLGATATALAATPFAGAVRLDAQAPANGARDLGLINGQIHTMDRANRVVSQLLIQNGRFAAVGNNLVRRGGGLTVVDLKGRTVIPGIIDAHNHIVLVGNRPGWHTPLEHVFTIPDAVAVLKARAANVPAGEFVTTVGPISAMQFDERRLPNLTELDAVGRPVYLQAAQGGTRTNTEGKAWLEARRVTVAADGTIAGQAAGLALQTLRKTLLTPDTRRRTALDAL
jgi:predicted amidohydrolase YtcJ